MAIVCEHMASIMAKAIQSKRGVVASRKDFPKGPKLFEQDPEFLACQRRIILGRQLQLAAARAGLPSLLLSLPW